MQADVTIESVGARGDGIGRIGDRRVAVEGAAPGDRVRVRVTAERADTLVGTVAELLEAGPLRRAPPCPHFDACGGCATQHLAEHAYADWKRGLLLTALSRNGLDGVAVEPTVQVAPATRRRARLSALGTARGAVLGFSERASRRLVDVAVCLILTPRLEALLPGMRAFLGDVLPSGARMDVDLLDIGGTIDIGLVGGAEPGREAGAAAAAMARQAGAGRIGWRPSDTAAQVPLAQLRPVEASFGGVAVAVPPGAFLQATAAGEAALTGFVVAAAGRRVAELFCGLGTFTLPLAAGGGRVVAWDGAAPAVGALVAAARAASLPVAAETRDLVRRPLVAADLKKADTVLLDPPRGGAREQMPAVTASRAGTVIYVSCNPVSFARDARMLVDAGFRLERILPVDQFLWSPHFELAALFRR